MEYLCLYKERWFLSYMITSLIFLILLSITGLSSNVQNNLMSIYLLLHIYIVMFYKNKECKIYKFNKLKNELG